MAMNAWLRITVCPLYDYSQTFQTMPALLLLSLGNCFWCSTFGGIF